MEPNQMSKDALLARLREAEQAMMELTKDEEVSVEGSIFRWSELPDVLARNMRAVTEARQEAKRWAIQVEESTARLREAEELIDEVLARTHPEDEIIRPILTRYKTKTEGNQDDG